MVLKLSRWGEGRKGKKKSSLLFFSLPILADQVKKCMKIDRIRGESRFEISLPPPPLFQPTSSWRDTRRMRTRRRSDWGRRNWRRGGGRGGRKGKVNEGKKRIQQGKKGGRFPIYQKEMVEGGEMGIRSTYKGTSDIQKNCL